MFYKVEANFEETIRICYTEDTSLFQFSRNSECDLNGRINKEIAALKKADASFKFYNIYNDNDKLTGYFAIETRPTLFLTTFFIMPEFRKNKQEVWDYIISHFKSDFCAGLFNVNTRAIRFFEKNGAVKILDVTVEDKPGSLFLFKR